MIGNAERKIQSAFQSTLPARGATTFPQSPRTSTINFNPRSPHGERLTRVQSAARADNFNPRSPHGERRWLMCETGRFTDFNPRSPHGERLAPTEMITQRGVFQSTLPARGATRHRRLPQRVLDISIHAPRTGSDLLRRRPMVIHPISIHAPRTGSDAQLRVLHAPVGDFNPRSPHGERPVRVGGNSQTCYFNPRSPHGERQNAVFITNDATVFQSTLPARGATRCNHYAGNVRKYFNPRSPHGERPCRGYKARHEQTISIHAPRTGSDVVATNCNQVAMHFNPRSPHGERPAQRTWTSAWRDFNPRSPHGERRARRKRRSWSSPISIHAPRTGSDPCTKGGGADPAHFNPRSPHGERHGACAVADTIKRFQSTLPARGATMGALDMGLTEDISIHAPRTGSDEIPSASPSAATISIHAPRTGSDVLPST